GSAHPARTAHIPGTTALRSRFIGSPLEVVRHRQAERSAHVPGADGGVGTANGGATGIPAAPAGPAAGGEAAVALARLRMPVAKETIASTSASEMKPTEKATTLSTKTLVEASRLARLYAIIPRKGPVRMYTKYLSTSEDSVEALADSSGAPVWIAS